MYQLPDPIPPHPDESLPGLIMRNAEPFGFVQPERLFRRLHLGRMTLPMICQQDPSSVLGAEIGHLLGLDDAQYRRMTLWHGSDTLVNVLGSDVHHELVRHRRRSVCPECLAQSRHHRAVWLMDVMPVCAIHGTWIVQKCPGCHKHLAWHGLGNHRCQCGFDLRRAQAEVALGGAGPGIVGLCAVFHGRTAPLDFEFGPLLQVVLRLGLYGTGREGLINHGQRVAGLVRDQRTLLPELLAVGWDMLAGWPGSFHAGLARIRSHRPPDGTAGIERTFRGLHAWLFRWKKAGWGKPLAEEFARYVAASSDVASNRHALSAYGSRDAIRRADMSMGEAREFLRVSAVTIQRVVERNPSMVLREASPGVPSLLSGAEIRRLKRLNGTLLTIKGVQQVLGIGRPVFLNLQIMGLVRIVPETDYLLENRAYRRSDVEALLRRCTQGVSPIPTEDIAARGLVSLEGASRSWRTIYDIIAALDGGRLRASGLDAGKRGLRSILLDPVAVGTVLPHKEALCTSSDLCQKLGVKAETLRSWRRAGFIQAEEENLVGRHEGVFYSPEAIRTFHARFVTSFDLGRSRGKWRLTGLPMARDLVTLGVRPVSGPGVDDVGTYLFRRCDVTDEILARTHALRVKPAIAAQRETARQRVDTALATVAAMWGGETARKNNTVVFPGTGRVLHAVAGNKVSLVGRFAFHMIPETHAKLSTKVDAWLAFVPSEGDGFLLVPFQDVVWPTHVGSSEGKVKWLGMRLSPVVDERWLPYWMPFNRNGRGT